MREIQSRLVKLQERRAFRSALLYTALTIVFIVFIATFGITLITKISSLFDTTASLPKFTDTLPPPPPSFDEIPSTTRERALNISGSAEAESTLRFEFNGEKRDILVNKQGGFTLELNLKDGENTFSGVVIDSSGNEGKESRTYVVTFDDKPPTLTVDKPEDQAKFNGKKEQQITISGASENGASVTINDRFVLVNSNGEFSMTFNLNEGENVFTVVAHDQAGNTTEVKKTYHFAS